MGNLQIHHLKPAVGSHTAKTRVGRGDGSKGKTAGRGTKGTKARHQVRIGFEGGNLPLYMRLPKLRGFKRPQKVEFQLVNLSDLVKHFPEGGKITKDLLVEKRLVRKNLPVKILGVGEVKAAYQVNVDKISASARAKIEQAKGSVDA
jgi:large subunit ribosomal protein L15